MGLDASTLYTDRNVDPYCTSILPKKKPNQKMYFLDFLIIELNSRLQSHNDG